MNNSYYLFAERGKKRKYSILSNFIFLNKEFWQFDKKFCIGMYAFAIPCIVGDYIGNLLPSAVVSGLERGKSLVDIIKIILVLGSLFLVANMLNYSIWSLKLIKQNFLNFYLTKEFIAKSQDIDYEVKESKNYQETYSNVWNSANNGRGFYEGAEIIPSFIFSMIGIGFYGYVLGRKSIIVLMLVLISVGVNLFLLSVARKVHGKYYGKISKYARGIGYISDVTMDSAAGKDIRIYNMLDFILKKYDENMNRIGDLYGKIHNWYMIRNLSGAILCFLRDVAAYIYLVRGLYMGKLSASEFVFLIGVIASLASFFEDFLRAMMSWNTLDSSVTYFRDFLSTKSIWAEESEISKEELNRLKKKGVKVELRDVSFSYDGAEKEIIQHFNLTVNSGEKLALIGLNGAGKTTLVKLICGLYLPDEGSILINGIDRSKFSRKDYQSLISVMFQDSNFLPVSLDENLTNCKEPDVKRLNRALEMSGFTEAYMKLDKKGKSKLIKKLEKDAVDFSGGEKQKLIFARALYRDAPLIILDEPTAALDPIAEHELYSNFREAVGDNTCIYISHRLSSTRFCDRIILIENGKIVEEGSHDSLINQNGRYAELFDIQAKYYRKGQEKKEKLSEMEGGADSE